jgi:hypothetical protein
VTEWVRNSVWIDHRGFLAEIDKQASLNIYYIGFLLEGIARMADWLGDSKQAALARRRASEVAETVRKHFWSAEHGLFVDNLPRVRNDGELRLHERTLAMALLYGLCPSGQERAAVNVLATPPVPTGRPRPEDAPLRPASLPANGAGDYGRSAGSADAVVRPPDAGRRWYRSREQHLQRGLAAPTASGVRTDGLLMSLCDILGFNRRPDSVFRRSRNPAASTP